MSTSPEPAHDGSRARGASSSRPEDEVVSALSHWLAFHLGNSELRTRLSAIGSDGLSADQAAAVEELLQELAGAPEGTRGTLEMHVRETLEAVALG